jgi:beta-lactamase class A
VAPGAGRRDPSLEARLATIASGFSGYAAIWIHDLHTGRSAAWNEQARFPAASTVKLGVLAAALHRYGPRPEHSPFAYDMSTLAAWSSNLAANRLLEQFGRGNQGTGRAVVEDELRRLGATRSTYPGEYRVGTTTSFGPGQPPLVSGRTTTAADLGHVFESLQAAALGDRTTEERTGLSQHEARVALSYLLHSLPAADNVGLFRPFLPRGAPMAQKNGWIESARHTAAIIYASQGPVVVVVLTYRTTLTLAEAQLFARRVLAASGVS